MKKSILNFGEILSKKDQKEVYGGFPRNLTPKKSCGGSGTGGVSSVGYSSACFGHSNGQDCLINGYLAACTGNGGGFWFY